MGSSFEELVGRNPKTDLNSDTRVKSYDFLIFLKLQIIARGLSAEVTWRSKTAYFPFLVLIYVQQIRQGYISPVPIPNKNRQWWANRAGPLARL